jgi:NACHT domain/Restriction endonuclease
MPSIRILTTRANERGDLFTRLVTDLFLALGYADQPRLNVQKAGREIDIVTTHRQERRLAVGECKAVATPVGGSDLNKFVGLLDAERRSQRSADPIQGYFISLSGFKESAIQQERDAGGHRFIMMDAGDVIRELVDGRILVSETHAMDRSARLASQLPDEVKIDGSLELLAHPAGFLWAIYFSTHVVRTHFALVHAGGDLVAQAMADDVVTRDLELGGSLHTLDYLPPPSTGAADPVAIAEVRSRYGAFIQSDYGMITLEGLPADQQAGSRQLRLEDIFVPLHLTPGGGDTPLPGRATSEDDDLRSEVEIERTLVGRVLQDNNRIAILAPPGAGKSTLVKRLATAYIDPSRRSEVPDELPARDWLPIVIRCRQLDASTRAPLLEIIRSLPARAEFPEMADAFEILVREELQAGRVLLLIDGLDEITAPGDRVAFVSQVRTFLATYPTVTAVITSRETGFRVIGEALASVCVHYVLSGFSDEDITRLTASWHENVVGQSEQSRLAAERLAQEIIDAERVRLLAQNPLLLTTLLLVQRWLGDLPRKRSALYGKAIEVLLATWNVEAYVPIDQDEAVPQLAFIAHTMMTRGVQTLSLRSLEDLLRQAREEMPEVLGFARVAVPEFIERVEERSSLLSLSGYDVEDGRLRPFYEFKHLTFQEYLAAVAVVDGFYAGGSAHSSTVDLLRPYFRDPAWYEVIGLTSVLCGRDAAPLIQALCDEAGANRPEDSSQEDQPTRLLWQALADEVQLPPNLVDEVATLVARDDEQAPWTGAPDRSSAVLTGKYGDAYRARVRGLFVSERVVRSGVAGNFADVAYADHGMHDLSPDKKLKLATEMCAAPDLLNRATGALLISRVAFISGAGLPGKSPRAKPPETAMRHAAVRELVRLLTDKAAKTQFAEFAACWGLAWSFDRRWAGKPVARRTLPRLVEIWQTRRSADLKRWAAWAIIEGPLLEKGCYTPTDKRGFVSFIADELDRDGGRDFMAADRVAAACVLAHYVGDVIPPQQIADRLRTAPSYRRAVGALAELLGVESEVPRSSRWRVR